MKRASVSGRQSSYMLPSSTAVTLRDDPRPIQDASFKNEAVRQILTFLSENLYGDVLTPKTLVGIPLVYVFSINFWIFIKFSFLISCERLNQLLRA
jgi:SMC interacting uncharacterized protein involved in chromosome segregation